MKIVFFEHPSFLGSQSMPRYANWLAAGMEKMGHTVEKWSPQPYFFKLPVPRQFKKWMGYIDQYIVFPVMVKARKKKLSADTLFVFTDHALGPWVPLVANQLHIIHCHDFLAQQSAMGMISENPTGWTGKKYQEYIRNGYRKGKNFISVSFKTRKDLHYFLQSEPMLSEVVYNGLTQPFSPLDNEIARNEFCKHFCITGTGYLLHIGGNHWYKNRRGCIYIYNEWRKSGGELPIVLVGEKPDDNLLLAYNESPFKTDIYLLSGVGDQWINKAYSGASVFLFPSLAEGFGWPIAEAMACGCPVITTGEEPMSEVGGQAAWYIPRMPREVDSLESWAKNAAGVINEILSLSEAEKIGVKNIGIANVDRFGSKDALLEIEKIYKEIR